MKKERLIAFSDAVLAIIMTILVLELKKPDELSLEGFWALRQSFFAYCLSFFWLGSVWVAMNSIWRHVDQISRTVTWWNLVFLFFASFMPYATGLVSDNFDSAYAQAFYGIIIIATSCCNWFLHKMLDSTNLGNQDLLDSTKMYRTIMLPDIAIKVIGLILTVTVYPQAMMYGVLTAAGYFQIAKYVAIKKMEKK